MQERQAEALRTAAAQFLAREANRNRGELGQFLLERTKGMRVPALEFAIDLGDKNRRRIDELSN